MSPTLRVFISFLSLPSPNHSSLGANFRAFLTSLSVYDMTLFVSVQ